MDSLAGSRSLLLDGTDSPTQPVNLGSTNFQGIPSQVSVISNRAVSLALYTSALDGSIDNTPHFKTALAAQRANGGAVLIPPGAKPFIASPGQLEVWEGVELIGANNGPRHRTLAQIGQALEGINTGSIIQLGGGVGGSDTDPAYITFHSGSVGRDFSVYEPDRNPNAIPFARPFALRGGIINGSEYGFTFINLELINPYRGLDVQGGRTHVENILGNPLSIGVRIDNALDWTEAINLRFSPTWSGFDNACGNWVWDNGKALLLGRGDSIEIRAVKTYRYGRTLATFTGVGGYSAYGSVTEIRSDLSPVCIENAGQGLRELRINDAELISRAGGNCYATPGPQVTRFNFQDGNMVSEDGSAPIVNATLGYTTFNNISFGDGHNNVSVRASGGAVVLVTGGTAGRVPAAATPQAEFVADGSSAFLLVDNVVVLGPPPSYARMGSVNGGNVIAAQSGTPRASATLRRLTDQPLNAGDNVLVWQDNSDDYNTGTQFVDGIVADTTGLKRISVAVSVNVAANALLKLSILFNGTTIRMPDQRRSDANTLCILTASVPLTVIAGQKVNVSVNSDTGNGSIKLQDTYLTVSDY